MRVDLFDYDLPEELIAAAPAEKRDESRLLVLERRTGSVQHRWFMDLPEFLREGDVLVMNDARVIPARLHAVRSTGGAVELLLVRAESGEEPDAALWRAMVRMSGSPRDGEVLRLQEMDAPVRLIAGHGPGEWTVSLGDGEVPPRDVLAAGSMPLPPYIRKRRRQLGMAPDIPQVDRERYQTVYARRPGAVAAPTAGLHFTEPLLDRITRMGVHVCMISLLVGPGTFKPVRAESVEDHRLQAEYFELSGLTASAVSSALDGGRRVVVTGTTTCRVLEHVARTGRWQAQSGWTDLFIYPPFQFQAVGALITNFHLPRSTLLMLVAALAGRQQVLHAYGRAVAEGYRFYSYGDAMFVA